MTSFLIATRNRHKVEEIRAILGNAFQYFTMDDFPSAPTPLEDASDFAGNATRKAVTLASWLASRNQSKPIDYVLADDSGLEVDALKGEPGVHSARFAAESGDQGNSPDSANNEKLLRLMAGVASPKRTGRFRCVIALTPVPGAVAAAASPVCEANEAELATSTFDGRCEGRIIEAPRGKNGFGYDPLFVPDGFEQTFGELGEETKNKLSHRARALEKLRGYLEQVGH